LGGFYRHAESLLLFMAEVFKEASGKNWEALGKNICSNQQTASGLLQNTTERLGQSGSSIGDF